MKTTRITVFLYVLSLGLSANMVNAAQQAHFDHVLASTSVLETVVPVTWDTYR